MKTKTYAIVSSMYPPHVGGVERYSYNLAKKLASNGNRVIVITSGEGQIEEEDGIRKYYLPSFLFLDGRLPVIKYGKRFKELVVTLKKEKIDYIIINTRFYTLSLWASKFAYKEGIPAILIEHGSSHLTFNNKFLDFFVHIYEHGITWCVKKYPKKYYGVSQDACKWMEHFGIYGSGTLYNAMNLEQINEIQTINYREKLGLKASDFIVTYVGRVVGGKGILELNQAMKKINKKNPNAYLIIAGDGPYMKEVEKKKGTNTILLGRIAYDHVISLLRSADVFCLPSETEGFPTSVLEAVACKCFVVTTKAGGSKELITSDELGIIMDNNSAECIESALERVMDNAHLRETAAEKCYTRLKENFTWDVVAQKTEEIFNSEN